MKIAYIITAYQDHKQLKRLVCSLDSNSDFFIHIDKKVNIEPFIKELNSNKNVFFTKQRFFINWGSFAQVLAIKELLRSIFDKGQPYDRVVCLSGMDYPIWSNRRISDEFSLNKSKQYIMGYNLSQSQMKKQLAKVTDYHFFRDIQISNTKIKRILCGASRSILKFLPIRKKRKVFLFGKMNDIYMGSDYWSLTIDCAQFLYDSMCKEDALMKYFKYSYVPSEMLIQTIIFNSNYSNQAIYYSGEYPGLRNLTPLHFIIYEKSIKIFNEFDIETLINSNKMFFRKAATGKSEHLISIIEKLKSV